MAPLPNGLNLFFVIVTSHLVALSQQQHLQSQQLQVPSSANERDADCWLALGAHRELQFGSNQRHLRRRRLQTYLQPAAATTTTLQRRRLRHQQSSSGRKEGFRVTGNDTATAAAAAANLLLLQRQQQQQQRNSSRGSGKRTYKRQALAVDLAVNRLHILESLDGQLREFAEAGNQRKQQQQEQQQSLSDHQAATSSPSVCQLPLNLPDVNLGPISSSSTQPERPNHLHHHYHQKHHKHHHQHNNNHHHRNNSNNSNHSNHSNNNNINNNHLPSCLASERLKRQVPPYMLNLQRQLLGEARTLAQAVRLMPYRSLVMRSFRQPVANQHHHLSAAAAAAAAAGIEEGQHEDAAAAAAASDLVVELNALGAEPMQPTATDLSTNEHLSAHYQQDSFASPVPPPPPVPVARQQATNGQTEPETSCDAKLAEGQLCYWFRISPQLSGKINGSLVRSPKSSSWKRERLVEAELHLFKLLPDLSLSQAQAGSSPSPFNEHISSTLSRGRSIGSNAAPQQLWSNGRDRRNSPSSSASQPPRTSTGTIQHLQGAVAAKGNSGWRTQVAQPQLQQHEPRNRSSSTFTSASASSSSSSYHLKTNLLEVSLYQILPRKMSRRQSALTDFPLRLLDIRRIDLYSSGWETFYVKRAVEDWVRDANLNLGLVIKAKSMFDEPIKVGLIRFADLRSPSNRGAAADWQANNHPQEWFQKEEEEEEEETRLAGKGSRQQQKQLPPVSKDDSEQFDSIHQPILVIYTTTAANADK